MRVFVHQRESITLLVCLSLFVKCSFYGLHLIWMTLPDYLPFRSFPEFLLDVSYLINQILLFPLQTGKSTWTMDPFLKNLPLYLCQILEFKKKRKKNFFSFCIVFSLTKIFQFQILFKSIKKFFTDIWDVIKRKLCTGNEESIKKN